MILLRIFVSRGWRIPGIEKYLPRLQAVLFDLNAIEDNDVPEDPEVPELKLVLTALKVVFRKDVSTKIAEILEEIKPITDDPIIREIVRAVWCYLVSSAKYMRQDYEILFTTIKDVVEVETMPTMLEIWTAERKAEWQTEAVVKDRAEMVLKTLRRRFRNIPQGIEESVHPSDIWHSLKGSPYSILLNQFIASDAARRTIKCTDTRCWASATLSRKSSRHP